MPRSVLEEARIHPAIRQKVTDNHRTTVREVINAVEQHPVVVVGMGQNPVCKRARRQLEAASVPFVYLEYGNYLKEWRRRNSIKMWCGWPTFPMVFVRGTLVGGASDLRVLLESGELQELLANGK